ncbi:MULTISPECIES: hypothetical protein [Burkholderiaceae]|uniref:hypothetical protein n=1 Tax=Burkholderiaceae TaxID=119060 RepID=UPI000966F5AF|nr:MULTISPECIES: hypothetical protein [Burkholderiaceae]MCG1017609.1 hypothetical protein [Mycetohabitans sp. B4]SIT68656.1 hypothetical protein SAMN04487768_1513 [Burkholderia sp. b13]
MTHAPSRAAALSGMLRAAACDPLRHHAIDEWQCRTFGRRENVRFHDGVLLLITQVGHTTDQRSLELTDDARVRRFIGWAARAPDQSRLE